MKVMPYSPEVDLDDLQERLDRSLPEGTKINGFEREDVAFGLVALTPTVIVPDDAGGTEAVEEAFRTSMTSSRLHREHRSPVVGSSLSFSTRLRSTANAWLATVTERTSHWANGLATG